MFLAVGILSALEARHRLGIGQKVETSLLEAAISFGVYESAHYAALGTRPPRIGQAHRGSSPYQVFKTADGWITVGAAQQNFWVRLCRIIERPEMAVDPRFTTNADRVAHNTELVALIQLRLETQPSAHWLAELEAAGVPAGPVLSHDEVFNDPQVLHRQMVVEVEHPKAGRFKTLGVPIKLSATPGGVRMPAPMLGEHSAELRPSAGATARLR
jgi:crotonobetainyl-CoA:carnitine CoA-transferase CaiB-like acyl-CoA transferase